MKMVPHQAPGKGIGNWSDIFIVKPKKMQVVIRYIKQWRAVYSAVVNVVVTAVLQWYIPRIWHEVLIFSFNTDRVLNPVSVIPSGNISNTINFDFYWIKCE